MGTFDVFTLVSECSQWPTGYRCFKGADGKQRYSWGITNVRIMDLAVTPDLTRLVVVGATALLNDPALSMRSDSTTPPGAGNRASGMSEQEMKHLIVVYDMSTKEAEL